MFRCRVSLIWQNNGFRFSFDNLEFFIWCSFSLIIAKGFVDFDVVLCGFATGCWFYCRWIFITMCNLRMLLSWSPLSIVVSVGSVANYEVDSYWSMISLLGYVVNHVELLLLIRFGGVSWFWILKVGIGFTVYW